MVLTPSPQETSLPDNTGSEFMEKTKYAYIGRSDQQKGMPQPPLELPPDPDLPVFDLPRPGIFRFRRWTSGLP